MTWRGLAMVVGLSVVATVLDAQYAITPDLQAVAEGKGAFIPAHVALQWIDDVQGRPALWIRPMIKPVTGREDRVIVLTGIDFTDGTIEFDALGQSDPPGSNFIGIAFRVVDETTHDVVYFRPFNFRADDPGRRRHAVQYVSEPKYPWFVLRRDHPGQFEKPVVPAPSGDAWFHARIVIGKALVRVYVDHAKEPSLVVRELSGRRGGGVGLWVGPGEGGYFSNLKILPAKE